MTAVLTYVVSWAHVFPSYLMSVRWRLSSLGSASPDLSAPRTKVAATTTMQHSENPLARPSERQTYRIASDVRRGFSVFHTHPRIPYPVWHSRELARAPRRGTRRAIREPCAQGAFVIRASTCAHGTCCAATLGLALDFPRSQAVGEAKEKPQTMHVVALPTLGSRQGPPSRSSLA